MPENRKIVLLGAGGHGKSVLDSLLSLSYYDSIGLIAKKQETFALGNNKNITKDYNGGLYGVPVVGDDNDLPQLYAQGYTHAFICVGSIGEVTLRRELYILLKQIGFQIPNIIDPTAVISPYATLGEGIFVGKNAVVNAEAKIGNCAIINTMSVIEHECCIGDFVHVAPGSILGGKVTIEADTHIGSGSVIKQGIQIGTNTMVGMGSVVLKDIGSGVTAYGNPCKEVEYE